MGYYLYSPMYILYIYIYIYTYIHTYIYTHADPWLPQVGDSFGEVALQTDQPRAATVKTRGDAIFATLLREVPKTPAVGGHDFAREKWEPWDEIRR